MSEREAVILGALLHDVGKFVQRASDKPTNQNHSKWGEEWVQNNLAEKLTPVFNETEKQIIRSAINSHHESIEYISLADAVSAGMDRTKLEDEETGDPFTAPLISIFSRSSITDKLKSGKYHKFAVLGEDNLNEVFPSDNKACSNKEYSNLLNGFNNDLDFNRLSALQVIDRLCFLLHKYTWCIPSAAYKDEPDVSLFDHLKTTAAIAGCFYDYAKEGNEIHIDKPSFLLIGGDISGVQSYIFDILQQQGKVAKRLRARSLFVQLLSEIAAHKILHKFNLPLCNLIMSAGGNFYIIAPNIKDAQKWLNDLQKEFDQWTLKNLKAELSISIESLPVSGKGLMDFANALDNLKGKLSRKKYQPHQSTFTSNDKWVTDKFLFQEVIEGSDKACKGCHKNPIKEDEEEGLCERCLNDIKIGARIPNAEYLSFFKEPNAGFQVLGYSFDLRKDNNAYLTVSLNDTQDSKTGFRFLATHIPNNNIPLDFEQIADKSQGDKLLGYLKADVDNMGQILRRGFKKPSISCLTSFSRMLETFFSGYIQKRMEDDYKDIYTIFSGGDDFFLVGPWNRIIGFAKELRQKFSEFCGNNPDLTFSAGIILAKDHEPISFCAEAVESELQKSKKDREEKDKITLFNQTVKWVELDNILKETTTVINWLKSEPEIVSRGFIHNLREYGEMSRQYEETHNAKYLKWVPSLTYDISRNLTKDNQKDATFWAEELKISKDKPKGGDNLPYLKTIMEYVLTYTRGD